MTRRMKTAAMMRIMRSGLSGGEEWCRGGSRWGRVSRRVVVGVRDGAGWKGVRWDSLAALSRTQSTGGGPRWRGGEVGERIGKPVE